MTQEQAMRMQEIKLLLEQAAASEGQQKRLSFVSVLQAKKAKEEMYLD